MATVTFSTNLSEGMFYNPSYLKDVKGFWDKGIGL